MLKHLGQSLNNEDKSIRDSKREELGIYQKDSFDFLSLVRNSNLVVGDKLAKNTAPLKIYKDQLVVLTAHAIYSNELNFLVFAIIEKIEKNFPALKGKIKKLNFQTANNYFKQSDPSDIDAQIKKDITKNKTIVDHEFSPKYQEKLKLTEQLVDYIEDAELKKLMKNLYLQLD